LSAPERPAVDASPIIHLTRAGLLDLLTVVGPKLVVPRPVFDELRGAGPADPAVGAVERSDWLVVIDTPRAPDSVLAWDLGAGETSVLAWAHAHPGAEAIMDDLLGRRCAAAHGFPVRGTVGVVLGAKKQRRIPLARPLLEQLRREGMFVSDRVVAAALALVGE
jgi:predicted nucleic acid-binding protein